MNNKNKRELELMARHLSKSQGKPWYVCDKPGKPSMVLSPENLKRYKNVYTFADGIQTVIS